MEQRQARAFFPSDIKKMLSCAIVALEERLGYFGTLEEHLEERLVEVEDKNDPKEISRAKKIAKKRAKEDEGYLIGINAELNHIMRLLALDFEFESDRATLTRSDFYMMAKASIYAISSLNDWLQDAEHESRWTEMINRADYARLLACLVPDEENRKKIMLSCAANTGLSFDADVPDFVAMFSPQNEATRIN
jgi:hypothetical protein